jgi:hypothetical protein
MYLVVWGTSVNVVMTVSVEIGSTNVVAIVDMIVIHTVLVIVVGEGHSVKDSASLMAISTDFEPCVCVICLFIKGCKSSSGLMYDRGPPLTIPRPNPRLLTMANDSARNVSLKGQDRCEVSKKRHINLLFWFDFHGDDSFNDCRDSFMMVEGKSPKPS